MAAILSLLGLCVIINLFLTVKILTILEDSGEISLKDIKPNVNHAEQLVEKKVEVVKKKLGAVYNPSQDKIKIMEGKDDRFFD